MVVTPSLERVAMVVLVEVGTVYLDVYDTSHMIEDLPDSLPTLYHPVP